MAARQRHQQGLLQQQRGRQFGVGDRRPHEARVEVAGAQRGDLLRQRQFAQVEPHAGMAGGELAQHGRHQREDARGHEADRQPADLPAVRGLRLAHRLARAGEDRAGVLQERDAGVGEGDVAAGAGEQRDAELVLEAADRERQRRLRDREPLRGAAEVQLLGERGEVAEGAQLHGIDIFGK